MSWVNEPGSPNHELLFYCPADGISLSYKLWQVVRGQDFRLRIPCKQKDEMQGVMTPLLAEELISHLDSS